MTAAKIVIFLLQASIFLTVVAIGLEATWQDVTSLFRRPGLLVRSLVAMNIAMPVIAVLMAGLFHINPAVKVALIVLAVSPVPPILPRQQTKLGGSWSYVCGLLAASALLSIILVPLTMEIISVIFAREASIHPLAVAKVVLTSVLLPLGLGVWLNVRIPKFAERWRKTIGAVASILLAVSVISLLLVAGRESLSLIGNGTVLAIAFFVAAGIAVGHGLGGPNPGDRTALALATASRHPGLAMTIASANFPAQRKPIAAAIVLYFLVKALVMIPYNASRKRLTAASAETGMPGSKPRAA
jgi:bile acid:Na+ symporter, BASS family